MESVSKVLLGIGQEVTTEIDGWSVTYPASCNGRIADLGFVSHDSKNHSYSEFVHFDLHGEPYGTYMPKAVIKRIRAMRNRALKAKEDFS